MSPTPRGPRLRLVCVNDVYALDHLPRVRTLVLEAAARDPADVLLTTLAGDFVAPSLLSSLDGGRGMVDCLDAVPVTHVCFGNHEQDIPYAELVARTQQFRGTWLNTNMPDFAHRLPAAQVIEVGAPGGRVVRVGLVGVVTEDPSLYPTGAFDGCHILPANETVLRVGRELVAVGCACVVALTHQSLTRDRDLARAQGDPPVPLVVGGHEHDAHVEQLGGAWIVKAGMDATHAVVVDLAWPLVEPAAGPDVPEVSLRLEPVRERADDPALRARVERHMSAVKALEAEVLLPLEPGVTLSSVGTRVRQTSVGAMIATKVREALGVDACLVNGGGIRGNREYAGAFTYGDLETELPFANEVVVVSMPGAALRDAVQSSRAKAPAAAPGFLQVDDGLAVDDGGRVTAVRGEALEPERDYRVATVRVLFDGMDNIEALVRFGREHPDRVPPRDSGRELKLVVLEAFARTLWRRLGPFDAIDLDGDERVSADDLRRAVEAATRAPPSALLLERIFAELDTDRDGHITRDEAARAQRQ